MEPTASALPSMLGGAGDEALRGGSPPGSLYGPVVSEAERHLARGLELREAHRWKAAIREFEGAVAADSASSEGWYWLAVTRDNRGDEEAAIPAYRRAIEIGLDPDRLGRAWTWLASSLSKCGQPEDALTCLAAAEAMGGYEPHAEYARIRNDVQQRAHRSLRRTGGGRP